MLTETYDLRRRRGDTYPIELSLALDGVPLDITGATFKLAVNPISAPADALNHLFEVSGTILDAPGGRVEFPITGGNEDQTPGAYYYEVEMTDATLAVSTILTGRITFVQDIVK